MLGRARSAASGKTMSMIERVELSLFGFEVDGLGLPDDGAAGVGNLIARKGPACRRSAGRCGSKPTMAHAGNI
jgi:hypothetical protein